ncbi:MAG: T9SS type A sorting domain-containing protein [Ignavibacteria bacterium]
MKLKLLICLSVLFICFEGAVAQSIIWQKEYQYVAKTEGEIICQTFDSGFVASGLYIHGGYYVIRTDKYGDTLWTKLFYDRNPHDVIQIRDSSFIFVGQASATSGTAGFIQKISPNGNQIWKKKFGDSSTNSISDIIELDDNNLLCSGGTVFNTFPVSGKIFLLKVNQSGEQINQIYYDSSLGGYGTISFINENRIFISAKRPFITDMKGKVIRYSEITDLGRGLVNLKDNSFIFVKDIIDSNDYRVIHVTKTDSNFNLLGERNIKILLRVLRTEDFILGNNGFTICGIANTDIENRIGGFIMEIDQDMEVNSYNEYINDLRPSYFSSIRKCFDNGYVTVGGINPINFGYNNILITKTDSSGNSVVININDSHSEIWSSFELSQNYPNPFNPSTIIKYQCSMYNEISLKVFDILGKEVMTLVNEKQPAGNYSVEFDGSGLSSGIYIYRLESDGIVQSKKMTLIK